MLAKIYGQFKLDNNHKVLLEKIFDLLESTKENQKRFGKKLLTTMELDHLYYRCYLSSGQIPNMVFAFETNKRFRNTECLDKAYRLAATNDQKYEVLLAMGRIPNATFTIGNKTLSNIKCLEKAYELAKTDESQFDVLLQMGYAPGTDFTVDNETLSNIKCLEKAYPLANGNQDLFKVLLAMGRIADAKFNVREAKPISDKECLEMAYPLITTPEERFEILLAMGRIPDVTYNVGEEKLSRIQCLEKAYSLASSGEQQCAVLLAMARVPDAPLNSGNGKLSPNKACLEQAYPLAKTNIQKLDVLVAMGNVPDTTFNIGNGAQISDTECLKEAYKLILQDKKELFTDKQKFNAYLTISRNSTVVPLIEDRIRLKHNAWMFAKTNKQRFDVLLVMGRTPGTTFELESKKCSSVECLKMAYGLCIENETQKKGYCRWRSVMHHQNLTLKTSKPLKIFLKILKIKILLIKNTLLLDTFIAHTPIYIQNTVKKTPVCLKKL